MWEVGERTVDEQLNMTGGKTCQALCICTMAERIIRHSPLMFRAFFRLLLPPLLTVSLQHNGVDEQLVQKHAYCTRFGLKGSVEWPLEGHLRNCLYFMRTGSTFSLYSPTCLRLHQLAQYPLSSLLMGCRSSPHTPLLAHATDLKAKKDSTSNLGGYALRAPNRSCRERQLLGAKPQIDCPV